MALRAHMSSFGFSRALRILVLGIVLFFATTTWTLWYGVNSDKDDIHPLLAQLIPAGHCACETATVFECPSCLSYSHGPAFDGSTSTYWEYIYERDGQNEGLLEAQCNSAFPGLFEDVNRVVKFWGLNGNITKQILDEIQLVGSMTRAMIFNGNLYVIATKSKVDDHRRKMISTLGSIHRALTAFPDRSSIPDIEIHFHHRRQSRGCCWSRPSTLDTGAESTGGVAVADARYWLLGVGSYLERWQQRARAVRRSRRQSTSCRKAHGLSSQEAAASLAWQTKLRT